jgi:integrase
MLRQIAADRKLTRRKDGRYVCKVNGKPEYFGRDEDEAIERLRKRLAELSEPGEPTGERRLSIGRLLCDFMAQAKASHDATGKPNAEVLKRYKAVCDKFAAVLIPDPRNVPLLADLDEADYQRLAIVLNRRKSGKLYKPSTRQQYITIAQMILKYAADRHWLEPVKYRKALKGPSKAEKLAHLEERGELLFTPEQIAQLLNATDGPLHTAILLGINCAYGPTDIQKLTARYIVKEGGATWLTFPRPKTGERRRCPLWPETAEALEQCFPWELTALGIWKDFTALMDRLWGKDREFPNGTGFYNLRRSFAVIASEVSPDHVIKKIMGHDDATTNMTGRYRQGIMPDAQLQAAVNHVRARVLG